LQLLLFEKLKEKVKEVESGESMVEGEYGENNILFLFRQ
jgi:hypothetical protein